jgi:hypothetical protein
MLVVTLSVAAKMCAWSRRRIHRTRISDTIGELSHQRCENRWLSFEGIEPSEC